MNVTAVQDWLQVRRTLVEMETEFTALAIKVASGEESEQLLRQQRQVLEGQRELCTAAYERAFPKQPTNGAPKR